MSGANAQRRLRVGVIGAGRIAQKAIAPAVRKSGNAELHAVASRETSRASALGARRVHASYEALIDDPDVDVVFITTHNGLHRELTIGALRSGKHVICEKPLGLNATECAEMAEEAKRAKRRLMEAFMYRFHPQIATLQRRPLGDIRHVEAHFHFHLERPNDVRLKKEWGGGALLDVGCYGVNVARLMLGEDVVEVSATAQWHDVHGVDMETSATLRFASGATAELSCGFNGPFRQQVVVTGSQGSATLDAPFVTRALDSIDTYQLEIEDFCEAVLTGREPHLAADEGLKSARVLDWIAKGIAGSRAQR